MLYLRPAKHHGQVIYLDGTPLYSNDLNCEFDALQLVINGNIEGDNIKDNSISGSKIGNESIGSRHLIAEISNGMPTSWNKLAVNTIEMQDDGTRNRLTFSRQTVRLQDSGAAGVTLEAGGMILGDNNRNLANLTNGSQVDANWHTHPSALEYWSASKSSWSGFADVAENTDYYFSSIEGWGVLSTPVTGIYFITVSASARGRGYSSVRIFLKVVKGSTIVSEITFDAWETEERPTAGTVSYVGQFNNEQCNALIRPEANSEGCAIISVNISRIKLL